MKKLFSILFAVLMLLSGMHLSLATHLCGGEVYAVKLSVDREKASCGMCAVEQPNPTGTSLSAESCCKDEMSFYAVDNNYSPSSFQVNDPVHHLLQVFDIPKVTGILFNPTNSSSTANVRPPGNYFVSGVSLPDICVFRI